MDSYHRKPSKHDSRTGRDCRFCGQFDADFSSRNQLDRTVIAEVGDTASAHVTEDGYLRHRMVELRTRFGIPDAHPRLTAA